MMRYRSRLLALVVIVASAAGLAAAGDVPANPPSIRNSAPVVRDVHAPPHLQPTECCGADKDPEIPGRYLGRAQPKRQYDYGAFKCVVGQDGRARYFPRVSTVVDTSKRKAALPASIDWSAKAAAVLKRMYMNDRYGCCVISSRYHQIGFWTGSDTGTGLEGDDAEVYASYQSACGRGDNGCDMSAVNVYQQKTGLKVKGVAHKTDGSAAVDHTNVELVKTCIVAFGGLNVGMLLPNDWYASKDGADWGLTNSRIVGGHEVQAFGYDDRGVWISTWGGKRRILWAAFTSKTWIDEVYCTLSPDWYGSDRLAPNGIDADALKADLALVANGKVPPLPGPDPVPPTPVPPTPVPPVPTPPGDGFTGTLTYKDGKLVAVTPNGSTPEADLAAAGISPAIILDVLKLLADIRAKAPLATIMADLLKIVADLTLAEKEKAEGKDGRANVPLPWALAA